MNTAIAFKGDSLNGPEIIFTLKMLGGNNKYNFSGRNHKMNYFVDRDGIIMAEYWNRLDSKRYTLYSFEDFKKKYRHYIIGDVVYVKGHNNPCKITGMSLSDGELKYSVNSVNPDDVLFYEWIGHGDITGVFSWVNRPSLVYADVPTLSSSLPDFSLEQDGESDLELVEEDGKFTLCRKEDKNCKYTQLCTSKEQSKRLILSGINVETSDCYWKDGDELPTIRPSGESIESVDYIPAWSLGRLISIIPPTVTYCNDMLYKLTIHGKSACYLNISEDWSTLFFVRTSDIFDSLISLVEQLINTHLWHEN